MQIAAIYARYSTDDQRATSIEDQVRRAKEKAEALGYVVPDEFIFADAAISGTAKGRNKRVQYDRLIRAWERNAFDALFVDEQSRLARDPLESAYIQSRVERTRVRLVSTDGLDSNEPNWQLRFGFTSLIAAQFVRDTSHRVTRGMLGQLERNFMIGAPPLGYKAIREEGQGTRWVIDEENRQLVQQIFERRRRGESLVSIARSLNEQGIPSPRKSKNGGMRYWRAGTVFQLLRNPIFRGTFVWNGSAFTRAKAKREKLVLEEKEFRRPELRLIDDATWYACNAPSPNRIVRGGGKHVLAGLVSCGTCNASLTVSTGGSACSLYCAQCAEASRTGVPGRKCQYIAASAVQRVLVHAIEKVLTNEVLEEFRDRLRQRLAGGNQERINELKARLTTVERKQKHLARLIGSSDDYDEVLEAEYKSVQTQRRRTEDEMHELERSEEQVDVEELERQLAVDPRTLLNRLFGTDVRPVEVRAMLQRLFPKMIFLSKPQRFCAEFQIELAPGVALAEASGTKEIDDSVMAFQVRVIGGPKRPSVWRVEDV